MMTHKAHQRIADAWEQVLDACGIQRRERNKMYIQCQQPMVSAAIIEIQTAIDIEEITELSDAELRIKLYRRLRDSLQEILKLVEGEL